MEPLLLALLVVLVLGVLAVAVLLFRQLRTKPDQGLGLLQQQLEALRAQLQDNLGQQSQMIQQQLGHFGTRLDHTTGVFGEVQNRLGSLSETTKQLSEIGREIADLHQILRTPKLRGQMGEELLADMLSQMLPASYISLQHRFKSGEVVDAVIRLNQGLVPIDAKFPLENFRRCHHASSDDERKKARKQFSTDVKKHIDAIATKYILPDEGTFDFALMYIPAENIYYETIIKDDTVEADAALSSYALTKQVIPVSPNSLHAYLQVIVWGLRRLQIEKRAESIMNQLEALHRDLGKFQDHFDTLGTHLRNAESKYQDASRQLVRWTDRLESARDSTDQVENQARPVTTERSGTVAPRSEEQPGLH